MASSSRWRPVLGALAARHAEQVDMSDGEVASRRRVAEQRTGLAAALGDRQGDAVTLAEHVLDVVAQVAEGRMQHRDRPLGRLRGGRRSRWCLVVDEVGGQQLFGEGQVAARSFDDYEQWVAETLCALLVA